MKFKEALALVGPIEPQYDGETGFRFFESPHFPHMEVHGDTAEEVMAQYPEFLKIHLQDLDAKRVAPFIAEATPGWGGFRPGAGRPRKEPSVRKYLPADIAAWLDRKENLEKVRQLMNRA